MKKTFLFLLALLSLSAFAELPWKIPEKARITKLDVDNFDFEKGAEQWKGSRNFTVEETDAKHGKSAKLVVGDPMKDNVYVTRLIPVEAGARYSARCEIKTEGVAPAEGKMSSVGACLIIEWADKDSKWIEPGSYSKGIWKTTDWTMVECSNLKAPEKAGYMFVYIALRAKGTAWYDNFEAVKVDQSIFKDYPQDGQAIATNVPKLKWGRQDGIDTYTVELSQNSAFQGDVLKLEADVDPFLQIRKALAPGKWYWRVSSPGYPDNAIWSFTVTARLDEYLLPPVINADHTRLLEKGDKYTFAIDAKDGVKDCSVTDGKRTFKMQRNGNVWSVLPDGGWNEGLNTIEISATAANGAAEKKNIWIVCAPKPEKVVVIDKEWRYSENGKHIFPLGIYQVKPEYMAEVKDAGFEVIHSYAWEGSHDEEAAKAYLDSAYAAGLRVFIGFDRGHHTKKGIVQNNQEVVARRVGKLAAHPGLFCWYLFDEPEVPAYYVAPKQLTGFADLVRKLDPYHPVVMTTWGNGMNKYRKTWDTHWSQCYDKPAVIVKLLADHRRLLLNNSPITLLIHCYDKKQSPLMRAKEPVDWSKFEPDYDWMRAAAFAGIAKDVNGLWWWWYNKGGDWMTASNNPETWKNLCKVVEEVRSVRPILNADGKLQMGTVTENDCKLEWWMKTVDGKNTLIVVNTGEKEVEATIAPEGVKPVKVKLGRFGVYNKTLE